MDWDRLDRYLRRDGTAAELQELERWVAADPRRRALADAMRSVARAPARTDPPRSWDAERALRRVRRQIGSRRHEKRLPTLRLSQRARPWRLELAIAALGAAAAVVVFTVSGGPRPAQQPVVSLQPAREMVTAPGQRASLTLSDGTRLVLSPASHLRIPAGFGGSRAGARSREVWLDGEASFSVQHDSAMAFVVHTSSGTIEDLGTEFVLSTYPEERGLRVAVRDGRVALHARDDSVRADSAAEHAASGRIVATLERGDVARLNKSGRVAISRHQDVGLYYAGTEGSLVLAGTTLRDALPRLERWYGIRIHVTDSELLRRTVSGAFRDESAATTIGIIALALESKAVWRGNEVTIEPNRGTGESQ